MSNSKKDKARVAAKQTWELAVVAKKFKVSQKTVKEAIKQSFTKTGKHSIARLNVEKTLRKMILDNPALVKVKK